VTPPRVELAPGYSIARIVKGGWQLAGGHGAVDRAVAIADMHAFVDAGFTTFDCADIYTGVEALIGAFVRDRGRADDLQIHTKYVPDRSQLGRLTAADVAAAVERSLTRLGVDTIDLVQFHWWDYDVAGAIDALGWLADQRAAGRIRHLGVTNFDTPTLTTLLDAGLPIVSHQVQYSVLDQRPARAMRALCEARGVQLLCYGTVAGGFLSERYLDAPPPREPLENRSLVKYRLIVDEAGGWPQLQRLLGALAAVAAHRGCGVGAVAVAWVLQRPQVAAAIVGARHRAHLEATMAAASLVLDSAETAAIDQAIDEGAVVPGDVYTLERATGGRHAAIMRYELNADGAPDPGLGPREGSGTAG
jgi:aryl-alcohol dehydrogenase-like predicted oxidoreductase